MRIGYTRQFYLPFDEVLSKTKNTIQNEGFGILSELNMKNILKEKIGKDIEKYIILGVCYPPFAYKALQIEKKIGLLIPCNMIVFEDDGVVKVSAVLPTIDLHIANHEELRSVAEEIEAKLKEVVSKI